MRQIISDEAELDATRARMDALGGPGAALLVGLDNVFPPVPSELVLPLAGFSASQGTMSLFMALFWTTSAQPVDNYPIRTGDCQLFAIY